MEQLLNIIKKFPSLKVLVVGDVMLDEYVAGKVNRISPEAPVPILDVEEIIHVPGGAANTAYNLKSLGSNVVLAGVIGPDEKGNILRKELEKRGVNASGLIVDPGRKTTLKSRAIVRNQHIVRIDMENREPIEATIKEKILNFIKGQVQSVNSIIISDYGKGVITPNLSQNIIKLARENNLLCLVDPKGNDYSKYRNCHSVAPNISELAQALNFPLDQLESEGKLLQAGKTLLSHVMSDSVLLKWHDKGMILFEKNGSTFRYPAVNKKVIDVSGAGDTAIGIFALALTGGANLKQAVILASHACGIVVGKMGTAVVFPEELAQSLKNSAYENQA